MTQVTIHEAKTHLSRLIEKVMQGEEVVIAKRHSPIVRIQKIVEPQTQRRIGGLRGLVRRMGGGFDGPVPDMETWMDQATSTSKKPSRKRRS